MKKIILAICLLNISFYTQAQKDSSNSSPSDSSKKEVVDTIRIGNMIIINDKSKTGTYEIGRGIVKIDLNNGKGLIAMTCSGTTCTLSSNAFPKDVDSATYQVGIYDAKSILSAFWASSKLP